LPKNSPFEIEMVVLNEMTIKGDTWTELRKLSEFSTNKTLDFDFTSE